MEGGTVAALTEGLNTQLRPRVGFEKIQDSIGCASLRRGEKKLALRTRTVTPVPTPPSGACSTVAAILGRGRLRRREVRPVGTLARETDTSVPPATSPCPTQPADARLGAEAAYASRFLVCSACSGRLALFSPRQRRGDGGDGIFRRPGATPAVRPILLLSRGLPGTPDHPFLLYNFRCRHFYRDCIHRGDLTDLQKQGPEYGSLCRR